MANTDKNIVITPNTGSSANDPKIEFVGADSSTAGQTITALAYPESNGTLSFEGSSGQLFSITNDLTGTIFSVNDISGIPSIEVNADGTITLAEFGGNVGIDTNSPQTKLDLSNKIQLFTDSLSGAPATTKLGFRFNEVFTSGVWLAESDGGEVFNLGVNVPQLGSRDLDFTAGIFRLDNRDDRRVFSVLGYDVNSTSAVQHFNVKLDTGNVGIGTNDPASALQVEGLITGTAVTQSATDTTAGRLLKVGDFGVGAGSDAAPLRDGASTDTAARAQFFRADPSDRPTEWNVGDLATANVGGWIVNRGARPHAFIFTNSEEFYMTRRDATEWQAPVKFYHTGNLLGTVSQSAGVPTGAVIERGSNGSGEYVRFADGTQICQKRADLDFDSAGRQDFDLPADGTGLGQTFISFGLTTSNSNISAYTNAVGMRSSGVFSVGVSSNASGVGTRSCDLTWIGRWF